MSTARAAFLRATIAACPVLAPVSSPALSLARVQTADAQASPAATPAARQDRPSTDASGELRLVPAQDVPKSMDAVAAGKARDRALAFLCAEQHGDGSWGAGVPGSIMELGFAAETHYDWNLASNFLACLALLSCPETPHRRQALEKGLRWACGARLPMRGDDWDNDAMWTALYAVVALTAAADDARLQSEEWRVLVAGRGHDYCELLRANQVLEGGWGYYDDPVYTRRPKWATSFSTACVLPALKRAVDLGWLEDGRVLERATRYVDRCRLPNGAYEYDLNLIPRLRGGEHINEVPGSLGRIQVCNWALRSVGVERVTLDRVREGLQAFFDEHRFLDAARLRPIPHEAYFQNAGYFYFFGHYYAALAINLLPAEEREAWHARLRPHLVKAQRENGSCTDFLDSVYEITASTAFLALALNEGVPGGS